MMRHEEAEEELNEVKAQLSDIERQRDRAFDELREIKRKMSESNVMTSSGANNQELKSTKGSLLNANRELTIKEKTIESLRSEVDKVNQLELSLTEKDASLRILKDELNDLKASMAQTEGFLSDSQKMVQELKAEVERKKESEAKLFDSFLTQKTQKNHESEENRQRNEAEREEIKRLQNELRVERENATRANEGDKSASMKTLVDEIGVLKNELKQAVEAEEKSKRAMDDLALALKEVATESNQAKEKLNSTEEQLKAAKEEVENSKRMVKCTEQTYEALLCESKKESDRLKNTIDRLRLEAEESLLAWNEKEIEFVKCIKKTEAEKNAAQEENKKLMESMREAEGVSNESKEEIRKLRDILKQALNEANVAKEAASLARAENFYLKDALVENDKALVTLAQETERLRINEAEANEIIKELKRVIGSGSKKEAARLEKENKEQKKAAKKEPLITDNNEKEPKEKKLSSTFSFDLNQLWPSLPGITAKLSKDVDEYPEKDDALVGSIFDLVESPLKEVPTPHHRRTSSSCSDDGKSLNLENFEEGDQFDDMEMDRNSHGKRKAILRRFGDLLRRKNSHPLPKESPKEVPHQQKEVSV